MLDKDERGFFTWAYGFFGSGDPRDFQPDHELCSAEEIKRWQDAVARIETGENIVTPPAGFWNNARTIHVLAPAYGIGVYKVRISDEEASTWDDDETAVTP